MSEHPIESLMMTAMSSIQDMVDVNTIIGEPIETQNGITIIPISKQKEQRPLIILRENVALNVHIIEKQKANNFIIRNDF